MTVTPDISLRWPERSEPGLVAELTRIIDAVVVLGGAVGWLVPPGLAGVTEWLDALLAKVGTGDGALVVATVDGVARALGAWRRFDESVFRHCAMLTKIMAHPDARGLGLGRVVTEALVDDAAKAGIESVQLGVRGNNHLAVELYRSLGFEVWGTLPDVIAVGDERFDDVRMHRALARPAGVRLRGSDPDAPGGSRPAAAH